MNLGLLFLHYMKVLIISTGEWVGVGGWFLTRCCTGGTMGLAMAGIQEWW